MNGSKMYLDGDTYRERIPKPVKAIIIVFHVLASLLLLGALIFSINVGILYEPVTLIPIWFLIPAIVLYFVASGTLDAGFNRFNDKALGATPAMLWLSILFCGLVFIGDNRIAAVAISGGALMFIESLFVFVALGCSTERKRKYLKEQRLLEKKKQPKDFVPDSLKAATIVIFSLALLLVLVTMILAFVLSVDAEVTVYKRYDYSYQYKFYSLDNYYFAGIACLGALLSAITSLAIYCVGCKRDNNVMGITFFPMLAAMIIMGSLCIRYDLYGRFNNGNFSVGLYGGRTEIVGVMGWIAAGLLFLTYIFVVISLCVATREKRKIGKSGAVKQMTVLQGFDYNRQNWWD